MRNKAIRIILLIARWYAQNFISRSERRYGGSRNTQPPASRREP